MSLNQMRLHFHELTIGLQSSDTRVLASCRRLFSGWLDAGAAGGADLTLRLDVVDALPPLPNTPPTFADGTGSSAERILNVYGDPGGDGVQLHFLDGALVTVPLAGSSGAFITACLLPPIIDSGRFEDVIYTSLAPLLRRRGYFLVHAFAAARPDGQAVLITGPSRSGKTTAGLSLLLDGWQLLANDVALLERRPDGIYCLPAPGDVGIRPLTFALLPGLDAFVGRPADATGAFNGAAHDLIGGRWALPAPITAVCLARVQADAPTRIENASRALCLARLMEESMDRWDEATLSGHLEILQAVCEQSQTFGLQLGLEVTAVPRLIGQQLTAV